MHLMEEKEEELQRQTIEEDEEKFQAKGTGGSVPQVSVTIQSQINNLKVGGQLLPESARAFYEPRFGYDFSSVRLHTDFRAAETAQAVKARAFTVGRDVVFGTGQYSPETTVGKRLLAHELTHTIQQGRNAQRMSRESRISDQDNAKEQKAEHVPKPSAQTLQVSSMPMVMRVHALTTEEKAENLKSPRFDRDPRLEATFDNSPTMRRGERGEAVKKIQKALIDDGFDMPISTKKTGAPDGIFGKETKRTIQKFQRKHKVRLGPDGIIGRFTMGKLDELYAGPNPVSPEKKPEIEATEKAMGIHIVNTMEKANDPSTYSPNSGIWYVYNYKAKHVQSPALYPWDEDYRNGYANPTYFNRIAWMDWRLKQGVSASKGIKAWLKGLTIAECLTAIVAIEINTLRAAIGDTKFDENFGSIDVVVPETQRLRIKQGTKGTPVEKHIKPAEASATGAVGTKGNRPVKKGEWYYFYNHPKYLLKHPDGAFQGENAVYMGRNPAGQQLWSGLGISKVTEDGMLSVMRKDYNLPRNSDDYRTLVRTYASDAPELTHPTPDYKALYEKYIDRIPDKYRHDKGKYKDKITKVKILNDPAYTLGGTTRKGGFLPDSGKKLDVAKVKQLREK